MYPKVHSPETSLGGNDGTNGGATWTVVLYHELLRLNTSTTGEFSKKEARLGVGSISLVTICLQHCALVQQWGMLWLMFGSIIWVNGMRTVCREQEAFAYGDLVELFVALGEASGDTLNCLHHDRAASTMRAFRTHFLMIKANEHGNIRIICTVIRTIQECLEACKTVHLIVNPGRGEEFLVETPNGRRLCITEREFKIFDCLRLALQSFCKCAQQLWRMSRIVFLTIGGFRLIGFGFDHRNNRLQVLLLVWCKARSFIRTLKVDTQRRYTEQRFLQMHQPL